MAASAVSIYFSCKFSKYNFPFVAFHLCFSQYAPMKLRIQFRLNKVFTHTPFPTPSSSLSKATVTLSRCHTHIQTHACTMRQKEVHAAQGELKLDNRAAGPPQLPIPNASLPPFSVTLEPFGIPMCCNSKTTLRVSRPETTAEDGPIPKALKNKRM